MPDPNPFDQFDTPSGGGMFDDLIPRSARGYTDRGPPSGFVIDQPRGARGLPPGFVIDQSHRGVAPPNYFDRFDNLPDAPWVTGDNALPDAPWLAKHPMRPSGFDTATAADVGKSAVTGVTKGAIGLPGIPGSLISLGKNVGDWINRKEVEYGLILLSHKATSGGVCESLKGGDSHWSTGVLDGDRQSEGH